MKYKIILADPPWDYNDQGCRGAMGNHYHGMSLYALKDLPVSELADDDSVLFLWVTYPMLREGLDLMDSWGFEYKSIAFQWIKSNPAGLGFFFGLGRWTRGNTEACLLGVKGKPKRRSAGVSQIVIAPVRRHSAKPSEVRERIVELMGDLPRIELFARRKVDGWDAWGNEVKSDLIMENIRL